jgi:ribosomal protein L37AE/L43A
VSAIAPPPIITANIPPALREGRRFTAWRFEDRKGQPKPAKMPYSPEMERPQDGASSTNPAHWTTFENALAYAEAASLNGVMRAFDHSDRLVGVDLDNCRDPETGELTPEATERIKRADTYTEVSPSGTGVKMWMYGTMPAFGHKKGDVEMYGAVEGQTGPCGRFFAMTGQRLDWTPASVGYRPDFVLALHREVFGDAPDLTAAADDPDRPVPALQLGDEDVIRLAAESTHNGERFRRLWSGDTSGYAVDGNDGESEADCALCEILFYYGGPDRERVERLFPCSGLYREKWDRPDYRKRTMDRALRGKTRFYGDSIQTLAAIGSDGAEACACEACPARARVNYLERALLDRDDKIEADQVTIRVQLERLTELRERLDGWKTVLSNPKLKPSDRIAALPVIDQVKDAQKHGQTEIHVRYPGIVKSWGIPESTLGKSVAVLTEMAGAPLAKRNEPDNYQIVVDSPKRGAVTVTPQKTIISAVAEGDLYAAVGSYDPGLPQRGGKREPLPQCKDHPDADLVIRSVTQCATCRKPLEARERPLRRQNEGVDERQPPTVAVGTYCRQNDAVGGHDGEEQAERAANVIPMASRTVRHHAHVEVSQEAERRDLDVTGHCSECQESTVKRRRAGVWRCASCSAVLMVEPWAETPASTAPRCVRPRCNESCGPGDPLLCVEHRAEANASLPAVAGAEE